LLQLAEPHEQGSVGNDAIARPDSAGDAQASRAIRSGGDQAAFEAVLPVMRSTW